MSVWDFGGQDLFAPLHHLFLTDDGIYLLVINLKELLLSPGEELRQDWENEKLTQIYIDENTKDECLKTFKEWLNTIYVFAPKAPIFVVGTCKDCFNSSDLNIANELIQNVLEVSPASSSVVKSDENCFVFSVSNKGVENKQTGEIIEDDSVTKLRQRIEEEIHEASTGAAVNAGENDLVKTTKIRSVGLQVPNEWYSVLEQLDKLRNPRAAAITPVSRMTLDEVYELAERHDLGTRAGIALEDETRAMLSLFHDTGVIVWHDHNVALESVVVLKPQWLVSAASSLIRDFDLHAMSNDSRMREDHVEEWNLLTKEGVFTESILSTLWPEERTPIERAFVQRCLKEMWPEDQPLDDGDAETKRQQEVEVLQEFTTRDRAMLVTLFEKYGLIVKQELDGGSCQFIVPSILANRRTERHRDDRGSGGRVNSVASDITIELQSNILKCHYWFTAEESFDMPKLVLDMSSAGLCPPGLFERVIGKLLSSNAAFCNREANLVRLTYGVGDFTVHAFSNHFTLTVRRDWNPRWIAERVKKACEEVIRDPFGFGSAKTKIQFAQLFEHPENSEVLVETSNGPWDYKIMRPSDGSDASVSTELPSGIDLMDELVDVEVPCPICRRRFTVLFLQPSQNARGFQCMICKDAVANCILPCVVYDYCSCRVCARCMSSNVRTVREKLATTASTGAREPRPARGSTDPSKEQAYTTTTLIDPRKDSSAKGPGGVLVEFPAGFLDIDGEEEVVIEIVLLDAIETGSKEFVNLPEGFVPVSPLVSLQVKSSSTGAVLTNTFAKEVRATLPHCIRNANPNGFQVYCMRDGEATFNKLEDPLPFRSDDFSRSAVFATNHFTQFQIICAVGVAALAAAAVVGLAPQLSVHKELELAVMVLMKEGVIKSIAVVLRALDNGVLTIEDKIAQMIVDDGGWQTYRPRNQLEFTPGTKQIELSLETDSLEVCRSATPPFPTSRTRHVEFDVSAFDFDLVLHVRPAGGSDVDAYRFTLQDRGGGGVSGSGGGGDGCYSSGGGDSGGAAASSIQTEPQLQPQSSPSSLPIAAHIGERRQSINLARDVVAARAICNIDIVKYTAIWEQTLRAEGPDVAALETELDVVEARLQMSGDPQQPTTLNGISDTTSGEYLLQLNLAFEKVEATLFADVEDLVESLDIANLDFHRGPPKKDDRCFEKAQLAYNDDCSKIRDLRRASVVCPNIAAVRNVCAKLDADPKIQLLRVKNRFRRAYNAKDKSAGYRDVQFNIKAVDPETGIELVWELQVHLAAVEVLKMRLQDTADATGRTGHGRYVAFRDIVERL